MLRDLFKSAPLIIAAVLTPVAYSQDAPPSDDPAPDFPVPTPENPASELPAVPGPYPVKLTTSPRLEDFTIYAPAPIRHGRQHFSVIAWGNGGCADSNANVRAFLQTVASYGFVIVAPGAPQTLADEGHTDSDVMQQALTWSTRENFRKGSAFYHQLDVKNVAVMGWSCGGMQALANANDPRVHSIVLLDSGLFSGDPGMDGMPDVTKEDLQDLHSPIAYIIGGPVDIAYDNAVDDFSRINHVPILLANLNVGHLGTYSHPGGGRYATVAAHWLQWTLYHNRQAAQDFVGDNCGLCRDDDWTVDKKNIW